MKNQELLTLGHQIRHARTAAQLSLNDVASKIGRSPSQLSLIETGKREPSITLLQAIATATNTTVTALLDPEPPTHRAALEIELSRAQHGQLYRSLGLPPVKVGPRIPTEVLESLVGLQRELSRRSKEQAATPEEARRSNTKLRRTLRDQENYFPDIEKKTDELLQAVNPAGGPLSQSLISDMAQHLGFTFHYVSDLPYSTRSVTDLTHRRIYVQQPRANPRHDPRTVLLQALGHYVLEHHTPKNYGDFLRQRVETNYFSAALLMPERRALDLLQPAYAAREISIEDLRDAFAVSFEMAAHRFTNLATHHFQIPVHFVKVHESGTIYKAYENDGVRFPKDLTGAIEGQTACRKWTARTVFEAADKFSPFSQYTDNPNGTYWCTSRTQQSSSGEFSVSVGVRYEDVKWFRGRETAERTTSACPDPGCCRQPSHELADRWQNQAWPSARVHAHLLAALPPGTFPGVDDVEVFKFLDHHAPAD